MMSVSMRPIYKQLFIHIGILAVAQQTSLDSFLTRYLCTKAAISVRPATPGKPFALMAFTLKRRAVKCMRTGPLHDSSFSVAKEQS